MRMSNEIKCSSGSSSVFYTPPSSWKSRQSQCSSISEMESRSPSFYSCSSSIRPDSLQAQHNVPANDTPYYRAKHVQLNGKDPSKGIATAFSTPQPSRISRPQLESRCPMSERKYRSPSPASSVLSYSINPESFPGQHKVPAGDSPYLRAKHVQVKEKDPGKAIALFWSAINAGDRVDSALKDMATTMKQLNRAEEAIEAIKSFRHLCLSESQESLDNILIELYRKSGRIEDEIDLLTHKLKCVEDGMAFGGRKKKVGRGRCQGKNAKITAEQEQARLLGNLGWAHLQQFNYGRAEELYRRAQALEPDKNKQCNLAICLMHMNRIPEAKVILDTIQLSCKEGQQCDESVTKSINRALQMLSELDPSSVPLSVNQSGLDSSPALIITNQVRGDRNIKQRSFESPVSRTENWVSATLPNRGFPKAPMTEPTGGTDGYAVSNDQKTRIFWGNGKSDTKPVKTKERYSLSADSKAIGYSKESWADLVEEEEEQQLSGITDTSMNKNVESFGQTEDNENLGRSISSRKSSASRSLCFDSQQQETGEVEYFHSSSARSRHGEMQFSAEKYVPPMRRNGHGEMQFSAEKYIPPMRRNRHGEMQFSAEKYVPPMRRNRLRVFEDIIPSQNVFEPK